MEIWFFFTAFLMIASALGVVCFKNAIYSGLCLIVNLLGVAALFASLNAHFLSAVQVIVYAGAIMVLVMFVLMLVNARAEKPHWTAFAYLVAGGLFALLLFSQFAALLSPGRAVFQISETSRVTGSVAEMGRALFRDYVFLFEVASVLILASIAGAYWLAKSRKSGGSAQAERLAGEK